MTVVAKLTQEFAEAVWKGGFQVTDPVVRQILKKYGAHLVPMYPRKLPGPIGRTFILEAERPISERSLAFELAQAPGVEGAYTKPGTELPEIRITAGARPLSP